MKAVTYQGTRDMQVKNVADPALIKSDDILVRITSTAICGSDLHIYQGSLAAQKDYVVGHEPMGIVEEVGPEVTRVKKGDTVVVLGCGPIGLKAQKFAWMNGAKRVIAVDRLSYRLQKAKQMNNVETINFEEIDDAGLHIYELTKGGADVVIDCVGMDGKKNNDGSH